MNGLHVHAAAQDYMNRKVEEAAAEAAKAADGPVPASSHEVASSDDDADPLAT